MVRLLGPGRWQILPDVSVKVELQPLIVRTRRGRVPPLWGLDRCSPTHFGRELERDHAIAEV